jgi:hypothetical protein
MLLESPTDWSRPLRTGRNGRATASSSNTVVGQRLLAERPGISKFVSAGALRCTLLEEVERTPMRRPVGKDNVFDKVTCSSATSR